MTTLDTRRARAFVLLSAAAVVSFTRLVAHPGRSRTRHLALTLVAALLGVAASPVASGAAGAAEPVSLEDCLLSGVNFPADHEHLAGYVPEGYEIGTYGDEGVVAIWVFSCEGATTGSREIGPADLSVVGVLLGDDTELTDPGRGRTRSLRRPPRTSRGRRTGRSTSRGRTATTLVWRWR